MGEAAIAEKRALPAEGAVDELVDGDENARGSSSLNEPQAETEMMSVTPARFKASMLAR